MFTKIREVRIVALSHVTYGNLYSKGDKMEDTLLKGVTTKVALFYMDLTMRQFQLSRQKLNIKHVGMIGQNKLWSKSDLDRIIKHRQMEDWT